MSKAKKVQNKTDVTVVGAGPSGCFSALTAAKLGAEVIVCEEHKEIGLPSHCAGHISIKGVKQLRLRLPTHVIENEISGAVFYSPGGFEFKVKLASPITYVINRALFDKYLGRLAEKAGARFELGTRAEALLLDEGHVRGVRVKNGQCISSRVVIDAEGCSSLLSRQIGLQTFNKSLAVTAVQGETTHVDNVRSDRVEVYLGQEYAPGLFAWIIPRKDGSAKVGLAAKTGNSREFMNRFLHSHPVASKKLANSIVKNLSYHTIPLGGPTCKTYHHGFVTVGDAASQVKPTTGGGVITGLTCAEIAGEIAAKALAEDDFSDASLSRYEQKWKRTIGFDMSAMRQLRLMLNRLPDKKLDDIINLSSRLNLGEGLKKVRDIDFQGKALLSLLRSPSAYTVILYSLFASLI